MITKFKPIAATFILQMVPWLKQHFPDAVCSTGYDGCNSQSMAIVTSTPPHQPPPRSCPARSRSLNRSVLHPRTKGCLRRLASIQPLILRQTSAEISANLNKGTHTQNSCVNKKKLKITGFRKLKKFCKYSGAPSAGSIW